MSESKKKSLILFLIFIAAFAVFIYYTKVINVFTVDDAIDTAKEAVPENSRFVSAENERNFFKITFLNDSTERKYVLEVGKPRRDVNKLSVSSLKDKGSTNVVISDDEVKKIINYKFKNLKDIEVFTAKDNGLKQYKVSFKSRDYYGEAAFNPETAYIISLTVDYIKTIKEPHKTLDLESSYISAGQAEKNVLKEMGPGSKITKVKRTLFDGCVMYDISAENNSVVHDYTVYAADGSTFED